MKYTLSNCHALDIRRRQRAGVGKQKHLCAHHTALTLVNVTLQAEQLIAPARELPELPVNVLFSICQRAVESADSTACGICFVLIEDCICNYDSAAALYMYRTAGSSAAPLERAVVDA
jgi:hypothetical protein